RTIQILYGDLEAPLPGSLHEHRFSSRELNEFRIGGPVRDRNQNPIARAEQRENYIEERLLRPRRNDDGVRIYVDIAGAEPLDVRGDRGPELGDPRGWRIPGLALTDRLNP